MKFIVRLLLAVCSAVSLTAHALYDPPPVVALAAIEGAWQGALEYRDYQPPFKRVTLPTRLFVTASAPKELTLHYIFDDGPKKTVHSYDRLLVDTDAGVVRFSGLKADDVTTATIVRSASTDGVLEVIAERTQDNKGVEEVTRYRLRFGKDAFDILKTAGPKGAEGEFRNQYSFKR
ncbi:MAG: hypothetical protein JNN20_16545 [Betaproteobacteria bacterium]|nr:hypothetical protein [Betaproteobacteria bacterium]